ncbi:tissue inhibitor of metalloproteinase-like isoform X2 [Microplitis mediator]|uniref:tissue inhibitor of metalloproteinase-like isoform X2 n=1 Tax=Microplitis mediator TaxID=375433 RepID=UPI002557BD52|nr:tissue inhibitor of metalloproteinase-like isoform X2 [Microplitis mediator]
MKRLLILFFFGSLIIEYANGCTCLDLTLQQKFCNSDFVIKIHLKDIAKMEDSGMYIYHVDILETYRATDEAEKAFKFQFLVTTPFESICGLDLKSDHVAIVGGEIRDGTPEISMCSFHIENSEEMEAEYVNLRENFPKNCTASN